MNVIVHTDGTAELDERPAVEIARDMFDHGYATITLTADQPLGRLLMTTTDSPVNETARRFVVHLTGVHIYVAGDAILAGLETGSAHGLLELLLDGGGTHG